MERKLSEASYLALMEAMCKDAAENFEGGYCFTFKRARNRRGHGARLDRALSDYMKARERKYNALCVAMPEYSFFMNKEDIKPGLVGEYVIAQMIKTVIDELDDENFEALARSLGIDTEEEETK